MTLIQPLPLPDPQATVFEDHRFASTVRRCLPVVGKTRAIREMLQLLESLAGTDTPVLVTGESGTGKEHVARLLRETGVRGGPYLAHNCAALAEGTLESDLFGHVAGSFTGATSTRRGLFEEANDGTLFLDEIGDIGAKLQAQLLRVLQEGEIRRVGESRPRRVNVRVIAATHRDLVEEVRTGRFREDLFYRMNLVQVRVPALRERRGDIPSFVKHFLSQSVRGDEAPEDVLTPRALNRLLEYAWPGNVRQLRNEILRAAILTRGRRRIGPADFSEDVSSVRARRTARGSLRERIEAAQRTVILEALRDHGWNKTRAARGLGVSRQGLIKMMHRLELPFAPAEDG